MKTSKPKLPRSISYLRMTAQCLFPSVHLESVTEIVGHMLAMQGQMPYALVHAVVVRSSGLVFDDVVRAFADASIVRHRPMRGTLHVTRAEDYHWMRKTLNAVPSAFARRLEMRLSATEEVFHEAAEVAYALFATPERSVGRDELIRAWTEHFAPMISPQWPKSHLPNVLFWGLDRRGLLVEGPMEKHAHRYIDARRLPAADASQSGFRMGEDTSRKAALAEVAFRYARGHGPVTPSDLARWAGISKREASDALEQAVEDGRLRRYGLVEDALCEIARSQGNAWTFYMQPDLPERWERCREEGSQTLFLPNFDELHVGYENRTCLADERGEDLICPAKNGTFRPLLVEDGALVGVLPQTGMLWLSPPDARRKAHVEMSIRAMRARLERSLFSQGEPKMR